MIKSKLLAWSSRHCIISNFNQHLFFSHNILAIQTFFLFLSDRKSLPPPPPCQSFAFAPSPRKKPPQVFFITGLYSQLSSEDFPYHPVQPSPTSLSLRVSFFSFLMAFNAIQKYLLILFIYLGFLLLFPLLCKLPKDRNLVCHLIICPPAP